MTEEYRLISIGYPKEKATYICQTKREEGTLEAFVIDEERKYRELFQKHVEEVMG